MKSFYQRNLPHLVPPGGMLFVTFRLQDSIPKGILEKLGQEHEEELRKLGSLPPPDTTLPWTPHRKCQPPTYSSKREAYTAAYKRYFAKMDDYLDNTINGPHYEQYYWLVAYTIHVKPCACTFGHVLPIGQTTSRYAYFKR